MAITNNHRSRVDERYVYVDANPILNTLSRFWNSGQPAMIGVGGVMAMFLIPGFGVLITLICLTFLIAHQMTPRRMPLKLPMSTGAKVDPGNLVPGKEFKYQAAKAISCLGVDRETGLQVWEDSDNDRRHKIVLATTGAGKTFMLRFNIMMSMVQTTGIIGIDGKGDIELPLESISIIRRFMRDEDIRILNFKQGNANVYAENGVPRTNTFNPFATGSSTYIAEVLKALLSSDDPRAGKGDMWQKRAEAMCEIISKMATYKRDHGDFKIRPGTIAQMLELRELCRIFVDNDIPEEYKFSLKNYFATLPDFDTNNAKSYAAGEEFKGDILKQHGFVVMQLQPALQVLSDLYGFIFDTDTPEIDLKDVVINNRILLVLLPAMEQSEGTLRNTGKIILAALKGMIAGELGSKFQGNVKDILTERACSDPAPFKNFFDECGYYAAIPGIEILPAQGRGLGFAFEFIGQAYTDLEKGGQETADIIWANCNNKMIGKTESEKSYNKIADRLGETTVMVRESMEVKTGDFTSERVNSDRLAYAKRKRLEMSDLSVLREGQYYYVTNDKLISIQTGDPSIKKKVSESRYNQLVGLDPISEDTQIMLRRDFTATIARFRANIEGAKHNQLRLNNFPRLRSIVNAYRNDKALGVGDTLTTYQKALFDFAREESDIRSEKTDQGVNDVLKMMGLKPKTGTANVEPDNAAETPQAKPDLVDDGHDHLHEASEQVTANIDDIKVNSGWDIASVVAAAATQQETDPDEYRKFNYNKPQSFADAERARMAAYEENNTDQDSGEASSDNDDDYNDDLSYRSEIDGEIEHLSLMLEMGSITQEEYDEEVAILEEEARLLQDIKRQKESDTDQDSFDAHLEKDDTNYHIDEIPLDQLNQASLTEPSENTENNPPDNFYPSERAQSFAKRSTRKLMDEVMQEISDKFQVDI